ncbi:MAG: beta-propeller fold lactonase family protein [Gammaproteobacteria bacterium]|nr:beta-propeller fold lactonase family protein [Gammaproteobacteria bacterium]
MIRRGYGVVLLLLFAGVGSAAGTARYAFTANTYDKSLASYRLDASGMLHATGHQLVEARSVPTAVGVHPSGRFLLTTSKSLAHIAVYRIDPETGGLAQVPGSPFSAVGRSPFFIAFHPSGRYVYFPDRFDGILAFAFNPNSGALSPIDGMPYRSGKRTRTLVMHPSGRFLYATDAYSNTISAYVIDPATGKLAALEGSPFPAGDSFPLNAELAMLTRFSAEVGGLPYFAAVHPSGRFLYVTNWLAASLSAFHIDPDSGALSLLDGFPRTTGINPYAVAVHPSGQYLYVTNWADDALWAYRIDSVDGDLTPVSGSPFAVEGIGPVAITFDPAGRHAYVPNAQSSNVSVFDVDVTSGALSLRDTLQTRPTPWSLAVVPGEVLTPPVQRLAFGLSGKNLVMLSQSAVSGELKWLASIEAGNKPVAVVAHHDGRFVYVADAGSDRIHAFRIEGEQLLPVSGSPFAAGKGLRDLTVDINGFYLYAVNENSNTLSVYVVDVASGALAEMRGSPFRTGDGPVAVTLDAAARYVLVANTDAGNVSVFRYQTSLSPLVFEIDKYGSPFAAGKRPVALAEDPTGKHLYVVDADADRLFLFRVHFQSGVLEALPGSPLSTGKSPLSVQVHPNGGWVYVLNGGSHDISRYRRDRLQGALDEALPRVAVGLQAQSLRLGPAGRYLYVLAEDGKPSQRYAVDAANGALELQKTRQHEGLRELVFPVFSD